MNKARLQHYVPQFLLRRFTDADGALAVFDKSSDRCFTTGTPAVAAEAFFYDVESNEDVLTLEPGLAEVEAQTAGIIESIHQDASLQGLSDIDRAKLSLFIAIQALRTRHQRTHILHMGKRLIDKVNRVVPEDRPEARLPSPTEEDAKRLSLALVMDGAKEIAQIIAAKPWVLARAPDEDLYIGDNPVAMYNERDLDFYGNIGFAVPGVEIHFPLGPALTLFIPCPSTIQQARKVLSDAKVLRELHRPTSDSFNSRQQSVQAFVNAVDTGDPFGLAPENVERENFLQVLYAGRWIFSATGDFALARRIIREVPRYRSGPLGTVS